MYYPEVIAEQKSHKYSTNNTGVLSNKIPGELLFLLTFN